ncbi:MAG: hypothetical protein POELPBGB_03741 [Bacteroidia bacterium]|nr:hypothetical protein [Bacteroidia bacterium]
MTLVLEKNASRQKIDLLKKKLKKSGKVYKAGKHRGKIKLSENPLKIQKRLRDEW